MFRMAVADDWIDDLTFHDSRQAATNRLARKLQGLDLGRVTGLREIEQRMIYYNQDAREFAGLL
jgi:hypothetical protein